MSDLLVQNPPDGLEAAEDLAARLRGPWSTFLRAAGRPRWWQQRRLKAILQANARSAYGVRHGFAGIDSLAAFRDRVPLSDHRALGPWIARVARGEAATLTAEPVLAMERTGGSGAAGKLVPITRSMLREIAAATGPWLYDLHSSCPRLRGTRSYWSISPVTRAGERTAGGIPVGFADDAEYFGPRLRRALARLMAVPPAVARIADVRRWRQQTCLHLLACHELGLISVWSPTFLTQLMEHIARHLDRLLALLPLPRARAIHGALEAAGGELTGELLWPRLGLISCWADGPSRHFIPTLRGWFPRTVIQPKGLLATEGVVSFPLAATDGSVLAVAGHFFEFLDLEHPGGPPLLADQLAVGGYYSPLLTTGGGLYRYHLKDVVRCLGFFRATPLVGFVGKLDAVTDLCGEKLSQLCLEQILGPALAAAGVEARFALLSPVAGARPHYRLYLETLADDEAVSRALAGVEQGLRQVEHYARCRELGQLGRARAVRVRDGWRTYQRALLHAGQRLGDIKPTCLDVQGVAAGAFEATPGEPPGREVAR